LLDLLVISRSAQRGLVYAAFDFGDHALAEHVERQRIKLDGDVAKLGDVGPRVGYRSSWCSPAASRSAARCHRWGRI
jgi:hypothetical protein